MLKAKKKRKEKDFEKKKTDFKQKKVEFKRQENLLNRRCGFWI
jgi:hypothetical protein